MTLRASALALDALIRVNSNFVLVVATRGAGAEAEAGSDTRFDGPRTPCCVLPGRCDGRSIDLTKSIPIRPRQYLALLQSIIEGEEKKTSVETNRRRGRWVGRVRKTARHACGCFSAIQVSVRI